MYISKLRTESQKEEMETPDLFADKGYLTLQREITYSLLIY